MAASPGLAEHEVQQALGGDVKRKTDAGIKSISDKLEWYRPRSASTMCEEVLGKGESCLREMMDRLQGATEFLVDLQHQVQEWEEYRVMDAEVDEYLTFLRESEARMNQVVYVETLNVEAVRMLRTLRTFHNSTKAFDVVFTPESDDKRWKKGANSSTGSKTYRVVMPLEYFIDLFTQADLNYFEWHGGVRVHWQKLRKPWQKLFMLRKTRDGSDEPCVLEWHRIGGGPYVEVRTIELALDYTSNMTRYQVLQPKLHGIDPQERPKVLKRMLDGWVELVTTVKQAQMQCSSRREWPADRMLPWWPYKLPLMPVVCWVRKQENRKKRKWFHCL